MRVHEDIERIFHPLAGPFLPQLIFLDVNLRDTEAALEPMLELLRLGPLRPAGLIHPAFEVGHAVGKIVVNRLVAAHKGRGCAPLDELPVQAVHVGLDLIFGDDGLAALGELAALVGGPLFTLIELVVRIGVLPPRDPGRRD